MKATVGATIGAFFPPQCLGCGDSVTETGALCAACWSQTEFIGACACSRCGVPLPGDSAAVRDEAALLCDDCLTLDRPWRKGRAAVVYAGAGKRLVMALKHGDRPDLAPALGQWLATAAGPLIRPGMVVVPVPLHPRRLMTRKYNQAALLAEAVARVHGLRHLPAALLRTRHTPMQDHGSVTDRAANLEGALSVPPRARPGIEGRAVLLVDDVMASGATLAAATTALRDAGSGPVAVAVLARAIKAGRAAQPVAELWDQA